MPHIISKHISRNSRKVQMACKFLALIYSFLSIYSSETVIKKNQKYEGFEWWYLKIPLNIFFGIFLNFNI